MPSQEGGLLLDARTGQIVTPVDERPEWADGYAVAQLAERNGWYEKRTGQQVEQPEFMIATDLAWIGVDAEGDEVEIEANAETRQTILATMLGIDLEDTEGTDIKGTILSREVDDTYVSQPTSEATLGEIEGQSFEEKKAVNG